jgi:hypothetical protein
MRSDYVLMPGARLEIGPHGRPYETLGACSSEPKPCCTSCASGGPCTGQPLAGVLDLMTDVGFWLGLALGYGITRLSKR